jgi:hypothetical protein
MLLSQPFPFHNTLSIFKGVPTANLPATSKSKLDVF